MFKFYNPNPARIMVDDCVIRAICLLTGKDWERVYAELFVEGMQWHDWPNKNFVWGSYLIKKGYLQTLIPNTCPNCFTVKDFCLAFPEGIYLLAIGDHVVTVVDGDYYDTWDSGMEVPVYYWTIDKKEYLRDGAW